MKRFKHAETAEKHLKRPLTQHFNVVNYVKFWTGNNGEVKGGSFNVDLYMRVLSIKSKL